MKAEGKANEKEKLNLLTLVDDGCCLSGLPYAQPMAEQQDLAINQQERVEERQQEGLKERVEQRQQESLAESLRRRTRQGTKRLLWRWCRSLGLIYLITHVVLLVMAPRLMFQPPRPPTEPLSSQAELPAAMKLIGPESQPVALRYSVPLTQQAAYVVLMSHGNAEDLTRLGPELAQLNSWGFAACAYDYPGYSFTPGPVSVAGAQQALLTTYQWLIDQGWRSDQIVLWGRSLGGGFSLAHAAQHDVAGVILHSTFYRAHQVLTRFPIMLFDPLPNARFLSQLDCPVLIIHGSNDKMIPLWHGEQLAAIRDDPLVTVNGRGHNDLQLRDVRLEWQQWIQDLSR